MEIGSPMAAEPQGAYRPGRSSRAPGKNPACGKEFVRFLEVRAITSGGNCVPTHSIRTVAPNHALCADWERCVWQREACMLLIARRKSRASRKVQRLRRLWLESLESRQLLAADVHNR